METKRPFTARWNGLLRVQHHGGTRSKKRRAGWNRSAVHLSTTRENFLSAPKAVERPASQGAAADTLAVDHGLARELAHSNGSRVRCARAVRCHSPARAAAAEPGYR